MRKRSYGQYCGLARALDAVGERWSFLVLRDLMPGPKRFTDLRNGLPRIPTNVLSARLKELERAGVIQRRLGDRPAGAVVYQLTDRGRELEPVVLELGRWGAKLLGERAPDEIVTPDSMIAAMRSIFRPEAAHGVEGSWELRLGRVILHVRVSGDVLSAEGGPLPGADMVIEAGPDLKQLLAGEVTPEEALARGIVRITGQPSLLTTFARIFRI
ncbi:MAG: winged helix-turn-helix transcriptional regulator [Gemmatimonadales bacterium]